MTCSLAVLLSDNFDELLAEEDADDDQHETEPSQLADLHKAEATSAPHSQDQPSTSGKEDTDTSKKQPNTKDLKATGVARAAARLLEQDNADGGVAILSVSQSLLDTENLTTLHCLTL